MTNKRKEPKGIISISALLQCLMLLTSKQPRTSLLCRGQGAAAERRLAGGREQGDVAGALAGCSPPSRPSPTSGDSAELAPRACSPGTVPASVTQTWDVCVCVFFYIYINSTLEFITARTLCKRAQIVNYFWRKTGPVKWW